ATVELHAAAGCTDAFLVKTTAASNAFSLTSPAVAANGKTTFYAKAIDGAGNTACSAGMDYYTDNAAPSVTLTTSPLAGTAATATKQTSPTITGTTDPNATVYLYLNAACTGTNKTGPFTASATGAFTIAATA